MGRNLTTAVKVVRDAFMDIGRGFETGLRFLSPLIVFAVYVGFIYGLFALSELGR